MNEEKTRKTECANSKTYLYFFVSAADEDIFGECEYIRIAGKFVNRLFHRKCNRLCYLTERVSVKDSARFR